MKNIIVIGSPGAGKTTFSLALAKKCKLPVHHLDKLYWRDGWEHVSREEFDALLTEAIKTDGWIIDGNYSRTIPMRLAKADTVIFLDYPRQVCLCGAIKRNLKNRGKSRPDMGGNCVERFDAEFLKYIWNFKKTQRPKLLALLQSFEGDIHILKSRKEAARFLESFRI